MAAARRRRRRALPRRRGAKTEQFGSSDLIGNRKTLTHTTHTVNVVMGTHGCREAKELASSRSSWCAASSLSAFSADRWEGSSRHMHTPFTVHVSFTTRHSTPPSLVLNRLSFSFPFESPPIILLSRLLKKTRLRTSVKLTFVTSSLLYIEY